MMDFTIYDATDPAAVLLMYSFSPDRGPGLEPVASEPASSSRSDLQLSATVDIAGRQWVAVFRPGAGFPGGNPWLPWASLAGGLLLTGIGTSYVYGLASQTAQVQRLIAQRTSELETANGQIKERNGQLEVLNKEMSAAHERIRLILKTLQEAFIAIDATGAIIDWNKKAEAVLGWSRSEIIGRLLTETVIPPQDREAHRKGIQRFLATGEGPVLNKRLELTALRHDGTQFPVELTVVPVQNGDSYIFHAFLHDITARKERAKQLIERTGQLELANREMEAFSYSVSHDLRAPLRGIDGFCQALLEDYEDKLDDQGKDYLQRVRLATQRMGQLIDDMLRLSRVTRNEMRSEPVDLSGLVRSLGSELQKTQPARRVQFVVADGLTAKGDPAMLRVALENLLGNAWKFTGKNPQAKIEFGFEQHDGHAAYFVRDDGVGFDMAYADKLFGAFQRLHSPTEFPGTGVGLVTVQRIIHRHGGRIWAEAEVDKGAAFYFTLQNERS